MPFLGPMVAFLWVIGLLVAVLWVAWLIVYHQWVGAQVRDLSLEMIRRVDRIAGRHSGDLSMRLGKHKLCLVEFALPIGRYNFDAELAHFFVHHVQSDPEYQRLKAERVALLERPLVPQGMLFGSYTMAITSDSDMFDVLLRWCKSNVTPHRGAQFNIAEINLSDGEFEQSRTAASLIPWMQWKSWAEQASRWDEFSGMAIVLAGKRPKPPWWERSAY